MTNNDIYKYLLGKLRKSTKGNALSPDTFTQYLQQANWEFFNQEYQKYVVSQRLTDSFKPFVKRGVLSVSSGYAALPSDYVHADSASYQSRNVDIVTLQEYTQRLNDELTQPTATDPVMFFRDDTNAYFGGIVTDPINSVYLYYIAEPDDPYFDYYIDANYEVQYLTEGQSAYTLGTNEVYRDGTASGAVTSISKELDWRDYDKVKIANIILGYLGVQLDDQSVYQDSAVQEQKDEMLK